jgi:acyl transferase domain-containing protein
MRQRVVLVCPGRGTYTKSELGFFAQPRSAAVQARAEAWLAHADSVRAARGDASLRELDAAPSFGSKHMIGENAGALIYACTAVDAASIDPAKAEVVAVCGNSMGWYSALHVGGVFEFEDGFTVGDGMGAMQKHGVIGGQLIHPVVDDAWRRDPARVAAVEAAIAAARAAGHQAYWSIRLGGFAVLCGDAEGVKFLLGRLPKTKLGEREYPFQLQGHSAFHSPLLGEVSDRAAAAFAGLPWRAPRTTIIDGRGAEWRPLSADPRAIFDYTVREQILATYDFTASIRVALRSFAPDRLVLLGPGDTLGGAIAHVLIEERWQGIASKADFVARQKADPFLIAMCRPEQASLVS